MSCLREWQLCCPFHAEIYSCLNPSSSLRPDILGVAQLMTGQFMNCIDDVLRLQTVAATVAARQRNSTASAR